jgi:hypothetical protein
MPVAYRPALSCLLLAATGIAQSQAPVSDSLTLVREALETPFREQTGLGFRHFDCDLPEQVEMTGVVEFSCQVTDEEGDRFTYRLWRDRDSGASTVSQWQPMSQVPEPILAPLTAAAEKFLDAFAAGDWQAAANARHPALIEIQPVEALLTSLGALRQRTGKILDRRPMLFGEPGPGTFALEYRLDSEQGPLRARIQLRQDAEQASVNGYLITPEDGTPLAAAMLEEQAASALSPLLGAPVTGLRVDLDKLQRAGDTEVGAVQLGKDLQIVVLVSRIGTAFDYEQNDYRFSILDVPWMVARHEVENGRPDSQVRCPARIAPDGGGISCRVTREDGSEVVYRVEREAGAHRMTGGELGSPKG